MRPHRPPVYTHYQEDRHPGDNHSGEPSPQFSLFPNLPAELRLLIWKHAASEPQVLKMDQDCVFRYESGLLTACVDSRQAFLKVPGTVRIRHGLDGDEAPKALWWHPELDLVVLHESAGSWVHNWRDLDRIAAAAEIRHLALPWDLILGSMRMRPPPVAPNWKELEWHLQMTEVFPKLRTWEVYAGWIDSMDQQAADGRDWTDPGIVWIPWHRGLRVGLCSQLLEQMDPLHASCNGHRGPCTVEEPCEWHVGVVRKRLVGRPIFDVDRAGLGLDP